MKSTDSTHTTDRPSLGWPTPRQGSGNELTEER